MAEGATTLKGLRAQMGKKIQRPRVFSDPVESSSVESLGNLFRQPFTGLSERQAFS